MLISTKNIKITKYIKANLLVLFAIITNFSVVGVGALAADTLTVSPKITSKHLRLRAINYDIYILPPDNTFKIINDDLEFGIESKKYNSSITMKFQGAESFSYADTIFRKALNYYKQDTSDYYFSKSNNMLVKLMKYESLVGNDTITTFNMICGDEVFSLVIHAKYPSKYDKKLKKLVENSLLNIVITPNPDIKPEANVLMDFDYSLLGLKFFQRNIKSFAVFSEDGLPPNVSKGEKFVILASVFVVSSQRDNLAEQVIQLINNSFVRYIPSSIQVSRVSEIEIHQQNGIELEGVFENNEELNFLAFMVPTNEVYHIILAIATEKEKEDLYQKVREMLKTVVIY